MVLFAILASVLNANFARRPPAREVAAATLLAPERSRLKRAASSAAAHAPPIASALRGVTSPRRSFGSRRLLRQPRVARLFRDTRTPRRLWPQRRRHCVRKGLSRYLSLHSVTSCSRSSSRRSTLSLLYGPWRSRAPMRVCDRLMSRSASDSRRFIGLSARGRSSSRRWFDRESRAPAFTWIRCQRHRRDTRATRSSSVRRWIGDSVYNGA